MLLASARRDADLEASVLDNIVETRRPQHPPPGLTPREPKDHRRVAVGVIARSWEREHASGSVVLVGEHEQPVAESSQTLEGEQLIAEMYRTVPQKTKSNVPSCSGSES